MEEQDYIELDILLAKLRVVCLKNISQNDGYTSDNELMEIRRKDNAINLKIIRNINYIRTNMPLRLNDGTISIIE